MKKLLLLIALAPVAALADETLAELVMKEASGTPPTKEQYRNALLQRRASLSDRGNATAMGRLHFEASYLYSSSGSKLLYAAYTEAAPQDPRPLTVLKIFTGPHSV